MAQMKCFVFLHHCFCGIYMDKFYASMVVTLMITAFEIFSYHYDAQ
jgi:hypothetical protein